MIAGSAKPTALSSWLNLVASILIVGAPPSAPPVAFDGIAGRANASSAAELTFADNTIVRTVGSWLDDGWLPGHTARVSGSASNDGDWAVVVDATDTTLTFTSTIAFVAESPDLVTPYTIDVTGAAPDGFALYVGPQHIHDWTGGDVAVIVPVGFEDVPPKAFGEAPAILGAIALLVDVHVWGVEMPSEPPPLASIVHDIDRIDSAFNIFQNVYRALKLAARGLSLSIVSADMENDTAILRHGEAFIARIRATSFPIYDFAGSPVPDDLTLQFTTQIKPPGA